METLKKYLRRYFLDAMGAMSHGLFASLLIGTIFKTIGTYTGIEFFVELNTFAAAATGMAIGGAVAYALKAHPLVMFSGIVVGSMGYNLGVEIVRGDGILKYTAGPAGTFVAVIVAVELGMLVSKKTKVDIIVTPFVTVLAGFTVAKLVSPGIAKGMYYIGDFINTATEFRPIIMGIIISVIVGMILTLPISSAAICAMIGIAGLAGGAAVVGCCCNMIGFAAISFRENKWGGVVAQGLGTSMLQMGNIIKKPQIWIARFFPPRCAGALHNGFPAEMTGLPQAWVPAALWDRSEYLPPCQRQTTAR